MRIANTVNDSIVDGPACGSRSYPGLPPPLPRLPQPGHP